VEKKLEKERAKKLKGEIGTRDQGQLNRKQIKRIASYAEKQKRGEKKITRKVQGVCEIKAGKSYRTESPKSARRRINGIPRLAKEKRKGRP